MGCLSHAGCQKSELQRSLGVKGTCGWISVACSCLVLMPLATLPTPASSAQLLGTVSLFSSSPSFLLPVSVQWTCSGRAEFETWEG